MKASLHLAYCDGDAVQIFLVAQQYVLRKPYGFAEGKPICHWTLRNAPSFRGSRLYQLHIVGDRFLHCLIAL
jgi:hypothetical protein